MNLEDQLRTILSLGTLAKASEAFAQLRASGASESSLITDLTHAIVLGSTSTRYLATRLSATMNVSDRFLPAWLAGLDDPEWVVRESAAAVLREQVTDQSVRTKLIHVTLHDPKPHVREAAAQSLASVLQPITDYGEAVRHPFERQRLRAATAIGYSANTIEAEELLLLLAKDSHWRVRLAAVRSLARLPRTVRVQAMIEARAAENEPRVRRAATAALALAE